jgi:VCBS repeat-containing protein
LVLGDVLGAGGDPYAPATTPAVWVLAAVTRRELAGHGTGEAAPLTGSPAATTGLTSERQTSAAAGANRAPVITKVTVQKPDSVTGAVNGKVSATDADKDIVTYGAAASSAKGGTVTITAATGAFTYTPPAALRHVASSLGATNADKSDTVTVSVVDGKGGVTSQLVTVAIAPQNAAPVISVRTSTPNPNTGATTVTITASDPDGDIVGFFGLDYPAPPGDITWGNAIIQDGLTTSASFTYTPSADVRHAASAAGAPASAKTLSFTVQVQDSHGGLTHADVAVPITAQNATPTITAATVGTPNGSGVVNGKASAADADADTLTFNASSTAKGKVSINAKTGAFTYTPTAAARHAASATTASVADKTDTITITISDGHGGSRTATATVNLLPANKTPTVKASVGKANAVTGVVVGTITGSDTDKDTLSYSGPFATGKGTVTINASTGAFTYTPTAAARAAAGAAGAPKSAKSDTFTVTVSDAHGAVVTKTVTVTIAKPGPNSAPTIGTITVGQPDSISGTVAGWVSASDVNGDALTFSLGNAPAKGAVSVSVTGAFTYTPSASQRTTTTTLSDTFTVNVSDGIAITTTSVSVPVAPIPSQLVAGQTLTAGQFLTSTNGRYKLVMQGDGNLVLYDNQGGALWSTGTNGRVNVSATMQGDGNFVLYAGQTALWSTKTNGFGGARMVVQDDSNAVVYQGSTALWDRHAGRLNTGGGSNTGGGTSSGLSAKVAAFVAAFQGQVWGEARYGTRAYTDSRSMTNVTTSPYYTPDMVGECVSLVTQFLKYAFGITPGAWGDANNWQAGRSGGNQMAANGFSWHTDKSWQNGDILVYNSVHIGIYYNGQLFDSNDAYGARGANGLGGWAARHAGFAPVTVASGYVGYWRKNS